MNSNGEIKNHQLPKLPPLDATDFYSFRTNGYVYFDKTDLIKSILHEEENKNRVILRPPGFGKSLNLSMLYYFFDKRYAEYKYLFNGLSISLDPVAYAQQGTRTVLFLDFKLLKNIRYKEVSDVYKEFISKVYERYREVIFNSDFYKSNQEFQLEYLKIIKKKYNFPKLNNSLSLLAIYLINAYNTEKITILIDEFDYAFKNDTHLRYDNSLSEYMKKILSPLLSGEDVLVDFAVLAGTFIVDRDFESMLGGYHIYSCKKTSEHSNDFGFTLNEIQDKMTEMKLGEPDPELATWYGGYRVGNYSLFSPYSIIQYLKSLIHYLTDEKEVPSFKKHLICPHSSNIINKILIKLSQENSTEQKVLNLQRKQFIPNLVLNDRVDVKDIILFDENVCWNFLYLFGLLTTSFHLNGNENCIDLVIPNREIEVLYTEIIAQSNSNDMKKDSQKDKRINKYLKASSVLPDTYDTNDEKTTDCNSNHLKKCSVM